MHRNENKQTVNERREYFRVDDAVRLSLRPVPPEQEQNLSELLDRNLHDSFTIMSSLAAVTAEMVVNMRRIENSDPDVAAYLKALDRKIEILGRAFIACESDLVEQPAHPVNLSAGGMAALINECYQPGQLVEIRMLLFPSFTGVLMYGTVVACDPVAEEHADSGYSHRVRMAFTHLREQDRDIIIRHVLRCQSQALRGRGRHEDGESADSA